jgi:hypothetical protein
VEWVKPIDEVEADFRRQGVFLLVNLDGQRLQFYGFKKDCVALNQMIDYLKQTGRGQEMVKFLIARARAKEGETK